MFKFDILNGSIKEMCSLLKRLINIQLDTNKKVTDLCVMLYDLNKSNLDLNKTNYQLNKNIEKLDEDMLKVED